MPRPALVVRTDAMEAGLGTVIVGPFTSTAGDAPYFRVAVASTAENGLGVASFVMVDKTSAVRRSWPGQVIGRLDGADMSRVKIVLAFTIGLIG